MNDTQEMDVKSADSTKINFFDPQQLILFVCLFNWRTETAIEVAILVRKLLFRIHNSLRQSSLRDFFFEFLNRSQLSLCSVFQILF